MPPEPARCAPLFSVIIPLNERAAPHVDNCLSALRSQTYPDWELILVAADAAGREIQTRLQNFPVPVTVMRATESGGAAARNRGAAAARGAWLVFTDPVCMPTLRWLTELAGAAGKQQLVAALAGGIKPAAAANLLEKCAGLAYPLPPKRERIHRDYNLLEGIFPAANLAVRRALFARLGGFDERLGCEAADHDLCVRIYRAGYGIQYLPEAFVRQAPSGSLGTIWTQAFRRGFLNGACLKQLPEPSLLIRLPGRIINRTLPQSRIWIEADQPDKKLLGAILAGMLWPPLQALAWLYLIWFSIQILVWSHRRQIPIHWYESPLLAGLLIARAAILTCGHIGGGIWRGVLCL